MMTQTEMIAMIDASWRELDAAIAGLEETALLEPGVVES
jgi:hypothetical protein